MFGSVVPGSFQICRDWGTQTLNEGRVVASEEGAEDATKGGVNKGSDVQEKDWRPAGGFVALRV